MDTFILAAYVAVRHVVVPLSLGFTAATFFGQTGIFIVLPALVALWAGEAKGYSDKRSM